MTKRQKLIENLAKSHKDLSTDDMNEVIKECFDYIGNELSKGNRIEARGFGVLESGSRKVTSPFSNKDAHTRVTVKYKMSKNLTEKLN